MRPARGGFRASAGRPTLAGESSELGLRSDFLVQSGFALELGLELLQAASFREERVRAGIVLGSPAWVLRAEWSGARAGIPGLGSEPRTRLAISLAMHSGRFAVGLRQRVHLDPASHYLRDAMSWAMQVELEGMVLALLREDALWGGDARWSAGLEIGVSSGWRLGLRGDDAQGQILLATRRGPLGFRLSLPIASSIDAGPYLALEWFTSKPELEP